MSSHATTRLLCSCIVLCAVASAAFPAYSQTRHPRLLEAGIPSGLPLIMANDNRAPAGRWQDGVLEVNLEVVWGDFRPETPDRPGLRMTALAESGRAPSIPGPLLRVETGTRIRAQVHNTLADSTITVFGLQTRPAEALDSLVIAPGATGTITFDAGVPGTYLYWVRLGDSPGGRGREREQLAGAFVIDPEGGSPPDRIQVINIWSHRADSTVKPRRNLVALTINGKSWPFTERIRPAVGDTVKWRIVNASQRSHPMHLHGFYFDVLSRGTDLADTIYDVADRRKVVTEDMLGRTTMAMEWVPTRPGNWLFHCHLSFHVTHELRLPGAADLDGEHEHVHMAGLVMGIEVQPGPTDLIARGEPREFTLHANEYTADSLYQYGFALDSGFAPDSLHRAVPGPLLLLKQYQPTYVTVQNNMSIPTGVHWHGLELDSWADGVAGWSASDGRMSPVIKPGASFTYKLSLMRPGTFIYHSHMNDIQQLTGGLYGPLLVLAEGDTFDPATDHVAVVGWRTPDPQRLEDAALNGRLEQPVQRAVVGETHRIRVINIAPAGMITTRMLKGEVPVPLRALAKDGADLPAHQQAYLEVSPRQGVGTTADFTFTPTEPGTYDLVIGYGDPDSWHQTWEVVAAVGGR